MTTFTVERCTGEPRSYGYTIRRTPPHIMEWEDAEGVGYCRITPRAMPFVGWYKYRHAAEARADILRRLGE